MNLAHLEKTLTMRLQKDITHHVHKHYPRNYQAHVSLDTYDDNKPNELSFTVTIQTEQNVTHNLQARLIMVYDETVTDSGYHHTLTWETTCTSDEIDSDTLQKVGVPIQKAFETIHHQQHVHQCLDILNKRVQENYQWQYRAIEKQCVVQYGKDVKIHLSAHVYTWIDLSRMTKGIFN